MDVGIWVDEGLAFKLGLLTNQESIPTVLYLLLVDTVGFTPANSDTVASLSQPSWSGYAPTAVPGWLTPTVDPFHLATCQGNSAVFSNTSGSPQTVYGWGLATGPTVGDTLLMCGKFAAPVVIADAGVFVATPQITDKSS